MDTKTVQPRACQMDAGVMERYTLTAKPYLNVEGDEKGALRCVSFVAASPVETMKWYAINHGQFERAFSRLIPLHAAEETVDALSRGESVEFPGLFLESEFGRGFHIDPSPAYCELTGPVQDETGSH